MVVQYGISNVVIVVFVFSRLQYDAFHLMYTVTRVIVNG